jgi:hypothetical protein
MGIGSSNQAQGVCVLAGETVWAVSWWVRGRAPGAGRGEAHTGLPTVGVFLVLVVAIH